MPKMLRRPLLQCSNMCTFSKNGAVFEFGEKGTGIRDKSLDDSLLVIYCYGNYNRFGKVPRWWLRTRRCFFSLRIFDSEGARKIHGRGLFGQSSCALLFPTSCQRWIAGFVCLLSQNFFVYRNPMCHCFVVCANQVHTFIVFEFVQFCLRAHSQTCQSRSLKTRM